MLAFFLKSLGGGKFLFSSSKTSIALSAMMPTSFQKLQRGPWKNVSDSI
jgi:hypothetical protein